MDLPTYTNIWRIEKRLYKLYDFRLPMPLPVGQIAVFAAIAVPYVVVLKLAGLPFSHTLLWLYVLPPGFLAWIITRPVLESKRLPELVVSQVRYLTEPRTWCRMAPLAEKDEIRIIARVWRRFDAAPEAAVTSATAAAELTTAEGAAGLAGTVWTDTVWADEDAVPGEPADDELTAAASPAAAAAAEAFRAAQARRAAEERLAAQDRGLAPPHRPARPEAIRAEARGSQPLARPAPPPQRPAAGAPAAPAATGRSWPEVAAPSRQSVARRIPARPAAFSQIPGAAPNAPDAPGTPPAASVTPERPAAGPPRPPEPAQPAAATSVPATAEAQAPAPEAPAPEATVPPAPVTQTPAPETPTPETPAPETPTPETPAPETPTPEAPAAEAPAATPPDAPPRPRPVVTVTGDQHGERPVRMVERALGSRSDRRTVGWHDHVVVVPGGHRPGRPDRLQRDRARARLAVPGGHRVVVLGCTVGAGQTVTTLLTGEVLASLREPDQVAVLDLNPGPGSLADRARAVPALNPAHPAAPSQLEVVTREAADDPGAQDDVAKIFGLLSARYPLTLADPGAAVVPRVLATASQLILVAPASQDAASALATTREWLEAHGHAELADGAITVLNGVSRHTMPHVEQAEALARGRCRAIVRVPWDDHLRKPDIQRSSPPIQGSPPVTPSAGALGPATLHAYTALAGVLVAALAAAVPEQMRARP